jgi:predicted aspartyl protease
MEGVGLVGEILPMRFLGRKSNMRIFAIVTLCAAMGVCASALVFGTSTRIVAAESGSAGAWKDCQSTDENKRLVGCTSVIKAHGFGSLSKLADALDGRCWAYNAKQQFVQAIEDCSASIRIRPRYFYAYNNLGTAYAGLHNYEEAIKAFNIAIDFKPDFYWSRLNRARALVAIGRNQSAAEDHQYLLKRDPTNEELIHALDALTVTTVVQKPDAKLADQTSIAMENEGGVYVVPVRFNDMITLSAIVDSGASHVSVPADVVSTLIRTKTITDQDFLGRQTYVLADGSKVPSQQFRIRSLKVGDKTVENVVASIASVNGEILLGQSFLNRFKSWSVDNEQHTLVLR